MEEGVVVPRGLLRGIVTHLEELLEGVRRIEEGLRDYEEGRFKVVRGAEELRREPL